MKHMTKPILLCLAFAVGCNDASSPTSDDNVLAADFDQAPSNTETVLVGGAPTSATSSDDDEDVQVPAKRPPLARLYLNDPVTDNGELSEVELAASTFDDGRLTSNWVEVVNCLNEQGGPVATPNFGGFEIEVTFCHEVQVVRPDADGTYLSITPPEDDSDPNDSFGELMMYHHVNRAHDYFKDSFGFTELDFPLPALVNVQFKTNLMLPFLETGPDGWVRFSNAAFFPKEGWDAFAGQFGLPPRDSDSIIFFQGKQDFAYDSRVIYHEYTHAVVGSERLRSSIVSDKYGLDNSPASMNEGLADYFAAALAEDPVIGAYVGVMGLGLRDLSKFRRCPEDTDDEIHDHGELIGSTLWALRTAVGADVAQTIAFRGLEQFGIATTHDMAAELFLSEAEAISPEVYEKTKAVFERHGFGGCVRSRPFEEFSASYSGYPHVVEGKQSVGATGYSEGVPAYKQFYVETDGTESAVRLTWQLGQSPSGGGGSPFGGGGSQLTALDVSVRLGEAVEISYTNGQMRLDEDARFTAPLNDKTQTVVLAGNCLVDGGGKTHLLYLNRGNDGQAINSMQIERLDSVPTSGFIIDCNDETAPDNDMPQGGTLSTDNGAGGSSDADVSVGGSPSDEESGTGGAPIAPEGGTGGQG